MKQVHSGHRRCCYRRPDLSRLTDQEVRVVRRAAAGLSNRAIGSELHLSPRTVGCHLYKAYPKLGIASRGELAQIGALRV